MKNLRKSDWDFIKNLRQNSRQTLTQISRKTKIPISTLYDKLKVHEKELIFRHASLIDFSKLGFNTKTQIYIKAPIEERNKIKCFLLNHESVNSLSILNNEYDYFVEGIFKHNIDARIFVEDLEERFNIKRKQIIFVAKDIRKEGFLAS